MPDPPNGASRGAVLFLTRRTVLFLSVPLLLLLIVLGACSYTRMPVLWGRGLDETRTWTQQAALIELPGNVLFVSDFHFRIRDSDLTINIPLDDVDAIVIVGDFFQSPDDFRYFADADTDEARIAAGLGVFLPDDFQGDVYWVSAVLHDPQIEPIAFDIGGVHVEHVGKVGRFVAAGHEVIAMHGDTLYAGVTGGFVSWLASRIGLPVPLERAARARLDVPEETWFVGAHSHVPAFHERSRTANTGSFAGVPFNDILRVHVGTGVLFTEDDVELLEFEGITPTLYP